MGVATPGARVGRPLADAAALLADHRRMQVALQPSVHSARPVDRPRASRDDLASSPRCGVPRELRRVAGPFRHAQSPASRASRSHRARHRYLQTEAGGHTSTLKVAPLLAWALAHRRDLLEVPTVREPQNAAVSAGRTLPEDSSARASGVDVSYRTRMSSLGYEIAGELGDGGRSITSPSGRFLGYLRFAKELPTEQHREFAAALFTDVCPFKSNPSNMLWCQILLTRLARGHASPSQWAGMRGRAP